jgi:sugar/nucleoside kinase (ribokinase family)
MRFASAAAVLCIQRLGAIPSMPSRAEVDDYLNQLDVAKP